VTLVAARKKWNKKNGTFFLFHLFVGKKVEPKSRHDQSPDGRLPHRLYAQARRPSGPR
jgi:hypothetical protein